MRDVVQVTARAAVFVLLWLTLLDDTDYASDQGGAGLFLIGAMVVVGLLWGVVDGLLARGTITRTLLRWAAVAPFTALLLTLAGGLADGAWLPPVDLARWVAGLVAMLYFTVVLPAGLGVVLGSAAQGARA
ncbi:MAG: hypothetical protein ACTHKG_17090 [Nocardioides sp.]